MKMEIFWPGGGGCQGRCECKMNIDTYEILLFNSDLRHGLEFDCNYLRCFTWLRCETPFDTISHSVLFAKLEKYGVRGGCLAWFCSYLCERTMRVKCVTSEGLAYSSTEKVEFGTPQGSVLGPLIFLIFNNDLYLHLQFCQCILFADDTTIYCTHKNLRHLTWCIWEDLKLLSDWFKANKLTLNISKSVCMLFSNKRNNMQITNLKLEGMEIPLVHKTKFLGIMIDDKLSWHDHFRHVISKVKRNMHMLRQGNKFLNLHAKKVLYFGHIFSHLNYCLSTWGPMLSENQIYKLQKLQNKCVNLIDPTNSAMAEKFKKNKILQIKEMIDLELCQIGFKFLHGLLPKRVYRAILTDSRDNSLEKSHSYPTRSKNLLNAPLVKSWLYYNSFLCKSMKCLMPLLAITKICDNIQHFITKFKWVKFATGDNGS